MQMQNASSSSEDITFASAFAFPDVQQELRVAGKKADFGSDAKEHLAGGGGPL